MDSVYLHGLGLKGTNSLVRLTKTANLTAVALLSMLGQIFTAWLPFCLAVSENPAQVKIKSSTETTKTNSTWQDSVAEGDDNLKVQKLVDAEECFRRALRQIDQSPHKSEDKVMCLDKLASTLAIEDKTEEALDLYRRSLHMLEQKYGKESSQVVSVLFSIGSIYESEGDPKLAMQLYRRALAINEKHYGPFSPAVEASLHRLGRAAFKAGEPDEAEHHYKRSLAILAQQPGLVASKELEGLLNDYSDLMRKMDTSDKDLVSDFESEFVKDRTAAMAPQNTAPLQGTAISAWQSEKSKEAANRRTTQANEESQIMLRGLNQPLTNSALAPAYGTMSDIFTQQHAYKEEEERYQRMIAIDMKALGPNHPTVADDLYGLVLLYISQKRYLEAKPLLERALAIYEAVYGNDSLLVTTARSTLATLMSKLGDTNLADNLYNKVLSQRYLAQGPNAQETAQALNELGFLYYRQGRLQDASTIYQWALASTEAASGKDSLLVAACLNDYAKVLKSLGRTAESNQMSARAASILAKERMANQNP
jgi:tetratricopeptide (TPR) repeat protein